MWADTAAYPLSRQPLSFLLPQMVNLKTLTCPSESHPVVSDSLRPHGRNSRLEYRSGLPFPSPGDLPNPMIEPSLPHCRWIRYQLSHQGSPI